MRKKRLHRLLALLLVTACAGESSTVVVVTVANVVVTPATPSVEVGLTVQFQASATDVGGAPVTGQAVTWASSVDTVASISADGVATGLVPGSTQVSATIGGVLAARTLTVNPGKCSTRTDVVLAAGQYLAVPGSECLLLPAGQLGDLYRVAVGRPSLLDQLTGDTATVTLEIDPVLAPGAPPAPIPPSEPVVAPRSDNQLPKLDGAGSLARLEILDATRQFHMELRQRERALGLDPSLVLPSRAQPASAGLMRAPPPNRDDMFLELDCFNVTSSAVKLIDFNDNLAIYQDSVSWAADPITTVATLQMLAYYDSYTKDMIVDYWGPRPDTDGNLRLIIVTSPSLVAPTAAAVYSGDFYPTASCPGSNEGEVIYFRSDLIQDLEDGSNYVALGIVAHEAKHVTSLYNGIQRGQPFAPQFNDLWIEEGMAEISQVMSSRIAWAATGGPAVNESVTRAAITASLVGSPPQETAEMTAVIDALAGMVRGMSSHPNSLIHDPDGASTGHSFYSTSWHWHRFLGDGFGGAGTAPLADSSFFRMIVSPLAPAGGAAGEIQVTGRGSFDQLFEDFLVGVSFHGSAFSPTREITTWDFVDAADVFSNPDPPGSYPWPVTADDNFQWDPFATASYTGIVGPSGVRFYDFSSSGTTGAQISVSGANDGIIVISRLD